MFNVTVHDSHGHSVEVAFDNNMTGGTFVKKSRHDNNLIQIRLWDDAENVVEMWVDRKALQSVITMSM